MKNVKGNSKSPTGVRSRRRERCSIKGDGTMAKLRSCFLPGHPSKTMEVAESSLHSQGQEGSEATHERKQQESPCHSAYSTLDPPRTAGVITGRRTGARR